MERKKRIDILTDALYNARSLDMTQQEAMDAFMSGKLPLRDGQGKLLNPYDYIGVTGKPYVWFEKESQEKYAEQLNGARKSRGFQSNDESTLYRLDCRISRLELVLTAIEKALHVNCHSIHADESANVHSQYRPSRNTRRGGNSQGHSLSCKKGGCQKSASDEPHNFSGLARFFDFPDSEGL